MNFGDLAQIVLGVLVDAVARPLAQFVANLNLADMAVFSVLISTAVAVGHFIGHRKASRFPRGSEFQNSSEVRVSRVLLSEFRPPDYHLMNHLTIQMPDGTTQIDHILVSRFGVFVIETKNYNGWVFADPTQKTWTQVLFRLRFKFQNPIFQNYRHVRAVRDLLDFLPSEVIRSVVVFTGGAEFKTPIPDGPIIL